MHCGISTASRMCSEVMNTLVAMADNVIACSTSLDGWIELEEQFCEISRGFPGSVGSGGRHSCGDPSPCESGKGGTVERDFQLSMFKQWLTTASASFRIP